MVSANVNKILQAAQALNGAERDELRRLLDDRASYPRAAEKQTQLDQLLLKQGVISCIPAKPTEAEIAQFRAWKPVAINGKSLSETIIEDRG